MILLDTSAIYAMADGRDRVHRRALDLFRRALDADEPMLVHNYVVVEAAALLQSRLGIDAALRFLRETERLQTHWLTDEEHRRAVALLEKRRRRGLSLVDCASFVVMRSYGIEQALAFDADFEAEGFATYSGA